MTTVMRTRIGYALAAGIILGIMSVTIASIEDTEREFVISNLPYGRGVDNDVQLGRIFLLSQRMGHPKRNSELINSLLGLPKNMNNAGRK